MGNAVPPSPVSRFKHDQRGVRLPTRVRAERARAGSRPRSEGSAGPLLLLCWSAPDVCAAAGCPVSAAHVAATYAVARQWSHRALRSRRHVPSRTRAVQRQPRDPAPRSVRCLPRSRQDHSGAGARMGGAGACAGTYRGVGPGRGSHSRVPEHDDAVLHDRIHVVPVVGATVCPEHRGHFGDRARVLPGLHVHDAAQSQQRRSQPRCFVPADQCRQEPPGRRADGCGRVGPARSGDRAAGRGATARPRTIGGRQRHCRPDRASAGAPVLVDDAPQRGGVDRGRVWMDGGHGCGRESPVAGRAR